LSPDEAVGPPGMLATVEEQIGQLLAREPVALWSLDDP
jgi:hypothetical protein